MHIYSSFYNYCRYCIFYWRKYGFVFHNGGFLVTQRKRIRESRKSRNEKEKYKKEHHMCEILKRHGFRVEHLSDNKREGSYDITLNGIPADLKRMTGSSNIVKNATYAIHKQNAQLIIFQFDKWDESFREKIGILKQRHIQGYYFLTSNPQRIHRF